MALDLYRVLCSDVMSCDQFVQMGASPPTATCWWNNAAALLGLLCLAVFAFKQLRLLHGALRAYVMTPFTRKNLKEYGSWAGAYVCFHHKIAS